MFPANAMVVQNALNTLATVLSLGVTNIGHVQLPVLHSNTASSALLKHRRIIEDHLMGAGLDVTQTVAVNFAQPQDARSSDRRSGIQTCIAVTGSGTRASLHWSPPALIGPLTLIKFTDLIGYDADVKPGPTARVEQTLCLVRN